MAEEYYSTQASMDAQYVDEYDKWVASLTPEEREQMEALGLLKPDASRKVLSSRSTKDAAESAVSPTVSISQKPRTKERDLPVDGVHDAIRLIVSTIISSANVKLEVIGLAFASGLSVCSLWKSQTHAAESHGWSRQHLNKSVGRWMRMLDLPPNSYTMPKKHKKKLSEVQKKNHWRKSAFKA